jgi:hypothetical protein
LTTVANDLDQELVETARCHESTLYFVNNHCQIYDATDRKWIPFHLWADQAITLKTIANNQRVVILKARQLGLTWLVLSYFLWLMLFRPAATCLLFSKREEEAKELLKRLIGIYNHLPPYLRTSSIVRQNTTEFELSNGSIAHAFPTNAGDSYTATAALGDEFDLVENQNDFLASVQPTVDGGGQLILLSRVDKKTPNSAFKMTYIGAKAGGTSWTPVFLPWFVRPTRTVQWYNQKKIDILTRTEATDELLEQYPATDVEALATRSLDKRFPPEWVLQCYSERPFFSLPLETKGLLPAILRRLKVYRLPLPGGQYVLGVDPAEGNPSSDDSVIYVVERNTGEEVAIMAGKIPPTLLGKYAAYISWFYNQAGAMIERNNHGHATIAAYAQTAKNLATNEKRACGPLIIGNDKKAGWLTTRTAKAIVYDHAEEVLRTKTCIIHSFSVFIQISDIDGETLKASEGK